MSPELLQALVDAGLVELCSNCVKPSAKGLCGACLEREGPKFAQTSIWSRLMGKRAGDGCPRCGSDLRVEAPTDGSMRLECRECDYTFRIETQEERVARERYEAKAEKRAQQLERQTTARRQSRRDEIARNKIPVKRVA